jgi:hypothetical protein
MGGGGAKLRVTGGEEEEDRSVGMVVL